MKRPGQGAGLWGAWGGFLSWSKRREISEKQGIGVMTKGAACTYEQPVQLYMETSLSTYYGLNPPDDWPDFTDEETKAQRS